MAWKLLASSESVRPEVAGRRSLTTQRNTFLALVLSAALFFSAVPAGAVPQSKVDQARTVKAQIDKLDEQVEKAAEQYNEASSKHSKLLSDKKKASERLEKLKARMGVVQTHLNTRASNMYRSGQMGFLEVLFGAETYEEFATTWDLLKDLNESDAAAVAELKELRTQAAQAHKEVSEKEAAAKQQVSVMNARKKSIEKQLAERKTKLRGIESEIAALEAAEERARVARATRAAKSSSGSGRKFPAPTRAPRSEVVNIAKRYLGAPYRWGADGPNSFDCSGFTMFVYRQVGVSLPHSSRAQINYGQRVNRSDLEPGDLVFFGSPIHHVGIYVGGGQYIHAPHTGDVVKISSLGRSDYSGACRP